MISLRWMAIPIANLALHQEQKDAQVVISHSADKWLRCLGILGISDASNATVAKRLLIKAILPFRIIHIVQNAIILYHKQKSVSSAKGHCKANA